MSYENAPLPEGWICEHDPKTQHPFWVDTKAKPPRSIWTHPYEDEVFLREHSDIRDRLAQERPPSDAPPPYSPRRHSYHGSSPSSSRLNVPNDAARPSVSQPGTPRPSKQKRGFFGKLKDDMVGTKEEREARHREEQRKEERYLRQLAEQRRQRQQAFEQQRVSSPFGGGLGGMGRMGRMGGMYGGGLGGYASPMYAAPAGLPFGRRTGFSSGFGGGGIGLPLFAGAAGGLLLGDMLSGPGWGGGGFDGGYGNGFDGGYDNGFGGGGFDGGF